MSCMVWTCLKHRNPLQILSTKANLGQGSPETTRAKNWPTNIRKRLTELVEKGKLTSELGPFSLQTLEAWLSTVVPCDTGWFAWPCHRFTWKITLSMWWKEASTLFLERSPTKEVNEENLHYSSVNGDWALRCAVAKYYNEIYRKGKSSLYTAENVAIVGGGRLALTRLCCAMDNVNLGHFLPDYTVSQLGRIWKKCLLIGPIRLGSPQVVTRTRPGMLGA